MGERLVAPALGVMVLTAVVALALLHLFARPKSDEDRARVLVRTEKFAEAEQVAARLVRAEPTVPHVLLLLDAHQRAVAARAKADAERDHASGAAPPMPEGEIDALVASLPPDVALVARFRRGAEEARGALAIEAMRDPPMPWANHVLAVDALASGDELGAASFYLREGTVFPERRADIDEALRCWIAASAWEEAESELATPTVAAAASPAVRYEIAVHEHDWRTAARMLPGMWRPRIAGATIWLAVVAAIAWAFFFARLGKLGARPRVRAPLYFAAFALGVLSVVPTMLLIAIEEAKLHLVESGSVARDLLFFVFGVGLREEASKLLLFLPLVPLLRRFGDKLDVLVCGAMVGLGFAAEENLGYLAEENLHTGLGRFLTANFLHAAMTGILASAAFDFLGDREKYAQEFFRASLFVVGLHGAYDFLIAHHELGGSYVAMGVFVILTKLFLDAVEAARKRADRVVGPMQAFVLALAVVTGASFAHAIDAVGVRHGLSVMAEGLLGEGIMIVVFAHVLARL